VSYTTAHHLGGKMARERLGPVKSELFPTGSEAAKKSAAAGTDVGKKAKKKRQDKARKAAGRISR